MDDRPPTPSRLELAQHEQAAPKEAPARGRGWRPWVVLVPAGVVAAAVAGVLALRPPAPPTAEPAVSFKGALAVRVVARRGATQLTVRSGELLAAGDALRFVITAPAPGYLSVFSLDGRGAISPFCPDSDPAADFRPLRLERAGQHELPGSVVLAAAPGPERLFVVFSVDTFDRRRVHARVRELVAQRAEVTARAVGLRGAVELISVGKRGGAER